MIERLRFAIPPANHPALDPVRLNEQIAPAKHVFQQTLRLFAQHHHRRLTRV